MSIPFTGPAGSWQGLCAAGPGPHQEQQLGFACSARAPGVELSLLEAGCAQVLAVCCSHQQGFSVRAEDFVVFLIFWLECGKASCCFQSSPKSLWFLDLCKGGGILIIFEDKRKKN